MGVAATHLDWSMVPYVRVSFWKHYNNLCNIIPLCKRRKYDSWDLNKVKETSINSEAYKGKHLDSFVRHYLYDKALALTKKELKQAVEGMYHNLKY